MRPLAEHLGRCSQWPSSDKLPTKKAEDCGGLALLEEMGFGICGRETLRAALAAADGSVEQAVAVLTAA